MTEQQLEEKTSFDGSTVKVLGETYEKGKPDKPENWREKLKDPGGYDSLSEGRGSLIQSASHSRGSVARPLSNAPMRERRSIKRR